MSDTPLPETTDAEIERLRGIAQRLLAAFPTAQTREQEDVWQEAYDALQEKADG